MRRAFGNILIFFAGLVAKAFWLILRPTDDEIAEARANNRIEKAAKQNAAAR